MDFKEIDLGQVLTIVIPALGAYLAAWLQNRKDKRVEEVKREALAQQMFTSQADKLNAGWAEMTTQAREIITRLSVETIDAKTRASICEDRADAAEDRADSAEDKSRRLELEVSAITERYKDAIRQLEDLKAKREPNRDNRARPRGE